MGPIVGTGGSLQVSTQPPARLCEICEDFPQEPILVEGAPANAATLFGDPSSTDMGAGPCVAEPADGTLFPNNWLRPRIRWSGTSDVYEVRLSTERQKHDLVVYTTQSEYYLPRDIWAGDAEGASQGLAKNNFEEDIVVTVRGVDLGGGSPVGSQVTFRTAAAEAGGTMVYWGNVDAQGEDDVAVGDAAGWLMGFNVGDEGLVEALRVAQVQSDTRRYAAERRPVTCIGCHASTPDGDAVVFSSFFPWSGAIAGLADDPEDRGVAPDYVTPEGLVALQQMWTGAWTTSPGQWRQDWKIAISTTGGLGWPDGDHNTTGEDQLMWANLAAPGPALPGADAWEIRDQWFPSVVDEIVGIVSRSGDPRGALMPDFSTSGETIAYTSTTTSSDGRIGVINDTDIYAVPFNEGRGGDAVPFPGAAQTNAAEYYPNFSGDDAFIVFNRVGDLDAVIENSPQQGHQNHLYYRPESELWIATADSSLTASSGETVVDGAIRLRANDPDACGEAASPGAGNSWAKFSPRADEIDGKTYYWLIFSSIRDTPDHLRAQVDPMYAPIETRYSRLFMAAFSVEGGEVTTYPAVYLWNQDEETNNLTPAWDDFEIPPVPDPPIIR